MAAVGDGQGGIVGLPFIVWQPAQPPTNQSAAHGNPTPSRGNESSQPTSNCLGIIGPML